MLAGLVYAVFLVPQSNAMMSASLGCVFLLPWKPAPTTTATGSCAVCNTADWLLLYTDHLIYFAVVAVLDVAPVLLYTGIVAFPTANVQCSSNWCVQTK